MFAFKHHIGTLTPNTTPTKGVFEHSSNNTGITFILDFIERRDHARKNFNRGEKKKKITIHISSKGYRKW